jgi:hypothetical protein
MSMTAQCWNDIDLIVRRFEDTLDIPDGKLCGVTSIAVDNETDILKIPNKGGCYWIWTNENIEHAFHNNKLPEKLDNGEIISNGIANDDIRGRIRKHLFGNVEEGMSAISVDLLLVD